MFTILLLPRFPVTFSATVSSGTWGKKLIEPFRYPRKKKKKTKEAQEDWDIGTIYLCKNKKEIVGKIIIRGSKFLRSSLLLRQTMRLESRRFGFFEIKRGADDAVQDHPKKTRFGRTCSRRKTADRNQTLPVVSRSLSRLFTSGDISILPIIRFSTYQILLPFYNLFLGKNFLDFCKS